MLNSRSFRKLFGGKKTPIRKAANDKVLKAVRLTLEPLEDRSVPATLTVNTLADDTNVDMTNGTPLTLREAILLVNNGGITTGPTSLGRPALDPAEALQVNTAQPFGVNDTIVFAAGLAPSRVVTAASWSAGTTTLTTASASSSFTVGQGIVVSGVQPAAFNGTFVVTATTATTVSYAQATNPGTLTTSGSARRALLLSSALPIVTAPNGVTIDGSSGGSGRYIIDGGSTGTATGDRIFFVGVGAGEARPATAITAAAWSPDGGGTVTFTAASVPALGQSVVVTGMTPSAYNGTFAPVSVTATTFTINFPTDPGTATAFGTFNTLPATANTNFTIRNLTLQNANARGGNGGSGGNANQRGGGGGGAGLGGALFVNAGNATVENVDFVGNRAVGGNGGNSSFGGGTTAAPGGGGGGMGGNGGAQNATTGSTRGGAAGGGFGVGANGATIGLGSPSAFQPGGPGRFTGGASGGTVGGGIGGIFGGAGGYGNSLSLRGGGGGVGGDGPTSVGGFGGGGGGGAGSAALNGGSGGFGGGGGGGGRGTGNAGTGGAGGFGGGGGGAGGAGGFGGGNGGSATPGTALAGGGGLGAGGAVFVRPGATLSVVGGTNGTSTVVAGLRGTSASNNAADGSALGAGLFLGGTTRVGTGTNGTGTLTSADSVYFYHQSALAIDINGPTAGATSNGYDQLNVTGGTVTLTGTQTLPGGGAQTGAALTVTVGSGYTPAGSFTILTVPGTDPANRIGTFNGLAEGATVTAATGQQFTLTYLGGDGNDVVLNAVGGSQVDLRLTKTVSAPVVIAGGTATFTITVTNDSTTTAASGVTVLDTLPNAFTLNGNVTVVGDSSTTITTNAGDGNDIQVADLDIPANGSVTITFTVNVGAASATYTNIAEITAAGQPDPDSTPGNGVPTEDDYATVGLVADGTGPTVTSITDTTGGTVGANSSFIYTVNFSEDVNGSTVNIDDFQLQGATAATITAASETAPGVVQVTVSTLNAAGEVLTLRVVGTGATPITDVVGNAATGLPASDNNTVTVDATAPTLVSITDSVGGGPVIATTVLPFTYTVTFSEDIDAATVNPSDFTNTGTANLAPILPANITEPAPGVFAVVVTPLSDGTVRLTIPAGATIADTAGSFVNTTAALNDDTTITVDRTRPTPTITRAGSDPTTATTLVFNVTFSEPVVNVDATDFQVVTTGTIATGTVTVAGGPTAYTVTIGGVTGDGTVGLRFAAANNIADVPGNPLAATAALAVPNSSFETVGAGVVTAEGDMFGNNATGTANTTILPGWTLNPNANHRAGVMDPSDTFFPGTTGAALPAPAEGTRVAFVHFGADNNTGNQLNGSVRSTDPLDTDPLAAGAQNIVAGEDYTLTVAVGPHLAVSTTTINNPPFSAFISLRANGAVVKTTQIGSAELAAILGDWRDYSVTLTAADIASGNLAGQALTVELRVRGTAAPNGGSGSTFDNVRLVKTPAAGAALGEVYTKTTPNTAPTITSNGGGDTATLSVPENTTAVTNVTVNDPEAPPQTLTYSLSGPDAARFQITSGGVLTFVTAPDFEAPADANADNVYEVTVTVSDNGTPVLTDVQAISVTVTNVNDAPVITSNGGGATAAVSVPENTTAVTTVTATDQDQPAQTFTYALSGPDATRFQITTGGVLTFVTAPNFETPTDANADNVYEVTVTVSDNGTPVLTDVQAISVTVTNVAPSAPTDANAAANAVVELAANGTSVGITASSADPGGPAVVYSLTDSAGGRFAIDPGTGVVTVANGALLVFANNQSHTITVRASDGATPTPGTADQTFTINVLPRPVVTDANISISGATGTGGTYRIGDTVTATWNNTSGGDNNAGITGVTVDFSQFGGPAAVGATNSSQTWTATYTLVAGTIDATSRNVSVTATNANGSTTRADSTNATVDNIAPAVTDANISIGGATGAGGAFRIGDTVTATWNNTSGGDNNADVIASAAVNFSQFGGPAAVAATNSSGTWTATYTIAAGSLNGVANRNVSVTATDNAGNPTTTADTANATVDNVAPAIAPANFVDNVSGGPITANTPVTFTLTFSDDVANTGAGTLTAADLDNAGTSAITIGTITETSAGVFTVVVTPTAAGTLQLRLPAGAVVTDPAGNPAAVPVSDDTAITVNPAPTNGVFQFSAATYSTAEGVGTFAVTVTRTSGSTGAVTVPFTVTEGTATAGPTNDYVTLTASPLEFADGQTSRTIQFTIVDDGSGEPSQDFSVALGTPSLGSLGATSSTTVTITDPLLAVAGLTPAASGVIVTFNRAFDPLTLNMYDTAGGTLGAPDLALTGATTGAVRGSLVFTGPRTAQFVKSGTPLAADTYDLTLRSAANGFRDLGGALLDGDANGTAGGDYNPAGAEVTVAASALPVVSVADFARGPTQAVAVPATAAGLPVTISGTTVNGNPITAVDAELVYDPALLTPTGMTTTVSGWSATFNPNFATLPDGRRVAKFTFNGSTALTGTAPLTIGHIQATVPAGATYAAKQVLQVRNALVFDNTTFLDVPVRGDEAVHLVAYFGDTNGSQTFSGGDSALVSQLVVTAGAGLGAFQNADPFFVADANGSGTLTGGDASLVSQKVVGLPVAQISDAGPSGLPAFGPDPRLYIESATGAPGELVTVHFGLEATENVNPGLSALDYAFSWDATRLEYVGTATVGAFLAGLGGWGVAAQNIDHANGTARIITTTTSPDVLAIGQMGRTLAVTFRVRADAPAGATRINLRENVGTLRTAAENNNGPLLLVPAPTNADTDPGDGVLTVARAAAAPSATLFVGAAFAGDGRPADLGALAPGQTLALPIRVTATDPATVGRATAVFQFDPGLFTFAGVRPGAAGFQVLAREVSPGVLVLEGTAARGLELRAGQTETLFRVSLRVRPDARPGASALNLAASAGAVRTALFDVGGRELVLAAAPTDGAGDDVDGQLRVTARRGLPARAARRL